MPPVAGSPRPPPRHSSRRRSTRSAPPSATEISPMAPRIRHVLPARVARNTHFSHMSSRIVALACASNRDPSVRFSMAFTRSDIVPSRSPNESECASFRCTISCLSLRVAAIVHWPPSTRVRPNRSSRISRWRIPLRSGTIAVSGPTAGAKDAIASSRSYAFTLSSTRSNGSAMFSARTARAPQVSRRRDGSEFAGPHRPTRQRAADGPERSHPGLPLTVCRRNSRRSRRRPPPESAQIYTWHLPGGALERQNLPGEHLHWLPVLVQRSAAYLHNALVRFRARRQYFDDLAFHPQNIASARGPWPSDIPAQTDDARGERQSGCDQEPHGDRSGVPAARSQSSKDAGLGSRFIQVERLRIELRGERFDTILVYPIHP